MIPIEFKVNTRRWEREGVMGKGGPKYITNLSIHRVTVLGILTLCGIVRVPTVVRVEDPISSVIGQKIRSC